MELINRNPKIIILSGKMRSGKRMVSNIICNLYNEKCKCISISYAGYLKEYAKNILSWNGSESDKPRVFLQELGTDLIKNKIDEHMLIKRVIEDIKVYSYFYDVIVISDARYIDEIELIKKEFNNVITIHINSNNCILNNHITETSLDNYNNYDYVIDNNGSVDELCLKVKEVLFNE